MEDSIYAKDDSKPSKEGIILGKDSIKRDIYDSFIPKE